MIARWLAAWAALLTLATAANSEVLDRYQSGMIYVDGPDNYCAGFAIGGPVVMVPSTCVFDEGAREPRSGLSVMSHLHDTGSRSGPGPNLYDRWFVSAVHVDRALYDGVRQNGYSYRAPEAAMPVFLQIHRHDGANEFGRVAAGPIGANFEFEDVVEHLAGSRPTDRYGLITYEPSNPSSPRLVRSICNRLEDRGNAFALTDCDDAGIGPSFVFNMTGNVMVGQVTSTLRSDGAYRLTPVPQRLWRDLGAIMNGQTSGLSELRSFATPPEPRVHVEVWNTCDRTAHVGVRFKDPQSDDWTTKGFYTVEPGRMRLLPIETRNGNIYWTAYRDGDDYYAWRGDHGVRYDGTTLGMIPATVGPNWKDHKIKLTC